MNTQKHSAINVTPYEVVFGQQATDGIFPGCDKDAQPEEEDLMKLLALDCSLAWPGLHWLMVNDAVTLIVF